MTEDMPSVAKPCIALMGEFSAGKSTLANLLIGANPLPVQVVATQLPPVWISYGSHAPYRVDLEGVEHTVDINDLASVALEETTYIHIFREEDILQQCDLLDMPGISDPNMAADVWQRMISKAHGVIWCSHATQAWRQSEAAVWSEMNPDFYDRSILLLTRMDKVLNDVDRARVLKRVRKETDGLFSTCLPISLLQATQQQDDFEQWQQSGAEAFAKSLAELLGQLHADMNSGEADSFEGSSDVTLGVTALTAPSQPEVVVDPVVPSAPQIVPRRVAATGTSRRPIAGS